MDTSNKSGQQITSEYLSQSSLLGALANAVKDLTDSITCWNELLGYAERLQDLLRKFDADLEDMTQTPKRVDNKLEDNVVLHLNDLSLKPPFTNDDIAKHLSLKVETGQHTLIKGVNGVGKTSLYRTIAGLWKSSSGDIQADMSNVQFLPQRPYFMPQMTLRDQITYPKIGVKGRDKHISTLMKSVELQPLLTRYDLSDVEDWQMILSGGKNSVFGPVCFSTPKVVYLDEATAAINAESVKPLYSLLKQKDVTIVAISHTAKNNDFFNQVVTMEKNGFKEF